MTGPRPRIRLEIDRITADRPGLDRAALERALGQELGRLVAERGSAVLGQGGALLGQGGQRAQLRAVLPAGDGPLAPRVAAASVKALKR